MVGFATTDSFVLAAFHAVSWMFLAPARYFQRRADIVNWLRTFELRPKGNRRGPVHNGRYYMTYTANHTGFPHCGIGHAIADKSLGP